jgi:hypothetical protein
MISRVDFVLLYLRLYAGHLLLSCRHIDLIRFWYRIMSIYLVEDRCHA